MSEATVLTSAGLNALLGFAGALIGLVGAAFALREQTAASRARRLESELRFGVGQLRRKRMRPSDLEKAVDYQVAAADRLHRYVARRRALSRLFLGYAALLALAAISVYLVLRVQGVAPGDVLVRWFWVGLLVACLLSVIAYYLGSERRLRAEALSVSLGPLTIDLESSAAASPHSDLLSKAARWLRECDYEVTDAPVTSGFDLIGRGEKGVVALEVKAAPRLTVRDVDAVLGAAARWRGSKELVEGRPLRIVLFAPIDAFRGHVSNSLRVAEEEGVELYGLDADGSIHAFRPDSS
jgi:hypothetical protein